jgi:short-subunit dehydrogenase
MKLNDKVILLSGASRGIGAEAARELARQGAHVVLAARTLSELEGNAAAIRAAGGRASAVELDVTCAESVDRAVSRVLAELGRIDVLVNNAGNGGSLGFWLDADASRSEQLFQVHVFGSERMTRRVLPAMLERGSGRVVNVVSAVGYVPMPGAAAYSAAKAAVIAHTAALRGELSGTGIELVLFSPPHTQTESGKAWPLELPRQFSPRFAAEALVTALRRDRKDVLAGGNHSLLYLQRLAPALAQGIMNRVGLKAVRKVRASAKRVELASAQARRGLPSGKR